MIRNIFIIIGICITSQVHAIEWNGTKPIIDSMLAHYDRNQNYHAVMTDDWIKKDASVEPIGDTLKVFKFGILGYLHNGGQISVFTEEFDIYINLEEQVMNVRRVTAEELANYSQLSPTQDMVSKLIGTCDSARLIDSSNGNYTIEFYSNNPLIYKSRFILDSNLWIREIWRYYTNNDKYESQHTKFIVIEALTTDNIEEFDQDNYIEVHNESVTPAGIFENYHLNILRE